MSKTIIFMRHAKSDWSVSGQDDFVRTLNSRGLKDAPRMGKKMLDMGVQPDLILSSPAERAKLTAIFVAEQLKFDTEKIVYDQELYEASARTLLSIITQQEDTHQSMLIFGHNPTHSYISEYLTKEAIGDIPTAGAVCIEFEIDSWKMVSEGLGKLKWMIYPKMDEE